MSIVVMIERSDQFITFCGHKVVGCIYLLLSIPSKLFSQNSCKASVVQNHIFYVFAPYFRRNNANTNIFREWTDPYSQYEMVQKQDK